MKNPLVDQFVQKKYYGKKEDLEKSYVDFSKRIAESSHRFYASEYAQHITGVSYSASSSHADYYAVVESKSGKGTRFSIANNKGDDTIENLYLNIPGEHNLENAVGAALMTLKAGVSLEAVRNGLANFKGIKRRFEYVVQSEVVTYIDDYAHHPSELKAIISSVRNLYPTKKITAVFQPHLFSRTQDFMADFAHELSRVDELLLVPIYPAREVPIDGITSEAIMSKMTLGSVKCVPKDNVLAELKNTQIEVLLTLGAGDIDRLVQPIKEYYGG